MNEAEKNMKALFDTIPMAIMFWDMSFNIMYCNREWLRVLELSSVEECIEKFPQLMPEYQPEGMLSIDKLMVANKETVEKGEARFQWTHYNSKGEFVNLEIASVLGNFMGVDGVYPGFDTSALKKGVNPRKSHEKSKKLSLQLFH